MNFFKKKDFFEVKDTSDTSGLEKNLTGFDLILLGLGAIVGTGVFVLTGAVAAKYSGPAVVLSYAIAGITCVFVALVYTELATMLPTSGSIYTYSYVAFGELAAWIVGGLMIIELSFGAATVAAGWSAYVVGIIESAGYIVPKTFVEVPSSGGLINLPALIVVLFVGSVLYLGTKDSKRLNNILVFIKMGAIFVFCLVAAPHFEATNWENYMPNGFGEVLRGSSILFFAYTGFGSLASTAEECKNPKRDLTIGIIGSLVLSTIVYMIVAALLTGIANYTLLDNAQPLAVALKLNGSNVGSAIVATGAVAGMTTVIMMNIYAQSRIFYVIARDGLLPKSMAKIHHKYGTPYLMLIIFVIIVAILAAFCPYETLGRLSSMAALMDYIIVASAVILFRFTLREVARPFQCPAVFIVAPVAILASGYLLSKQIIDNDGNLMNTGKIMFIWLAVSFILYIVRSLFKENKNI